MTFGATVSVSKVVRGLVCSSLDSNVLYAINSQVS